MDLNEIKQLKNKLFTSDEILENFLKKITHKLLNSKIKNQTLSPILLTHKEFIDRSLSLLIKEIKTQIFEIAKQKKFNLGDKIMELKLEYLAGYILKYDIATKMIIHKTIAKYIINIIRKEPLKLNHFVSTLNKEVYSGKFGKFKYPILYPFDKNKYNNPIPEIKLALNKIDNIKKSLNQKETHLRNLKSELEQANLDVIQIKKAASDMKDMVEILKDKYKEQELKNRLMMIKNQHARFNVILIELKDKITSTSKEIKTLSKNIEATKVKYKDILSKEDEIIETIAKNLHTMKTKITT